MSYYLTAEAVGECSCHSCTCAGLCPECLARDGDEDEEPDEDPGEYLNDAFDRRGA